MLSAVSLSNNGLSLISSCAGDMRFCIRKSILDFSSGIVTRCSRASSNQPLIIGSLSFVGLPDCFVNGIIYIKLNWQRWLDNTF
jgi:hypothetical protein